MKVKKPIEKKSRPASFVSFFFKCLWIMALSVVLGKYREEILKFSAKSSYHRRRGVDLSKWSGNKIQILSGLLEPRDFYEYLVEENFIITSKIRCDKCGGKMNLQTDSGQVDGCIWKCYNKVRADSADCAFAGDDQDCEWVRCGGKKSVRANSFFSKSKLRLGEVLMGVHHFFHNTPASQRNADLGTASHTRGDQDSFCREVAINAVFYNSTPIGGPGIEVQLDESVFAKSANVFIPAHVTLLYFSLRYDNVLYDTKLIFFFFVLLFLS